MAQDAFVNRYSRADRLLHRLAFASPGLQVSLADIEDRLHGKALAGIRIDRPVFITALPRAGTTLVLNFLFATGEFSSHTYRNMPFVLCPVLWQRVSSAFRSSGGGSMERAHGDGVAVSVDSAEAFEEILWREFWPGHYLTDRIAPWTEEDHPEFVHFLKNHMRKLIWLADPAGSLRYLSKNNLNISRLGYLTRVFPDARVIVPFRDPFQHAASLLKQHMGFLHSHDQDPFAEAYMRGVGHYDFGTNLLPVDFGGWLSGDRRDHATQLSFWVEYWVAAYRHVLHNVGDSVRLFPFDRWTQHPQAGLAWLADFAGLRQRKTLLAQHAALRRPRAHETDIKDLPKALADEARELFDELVAASRTSDWER